MFRLSPLLLKEQVCEGFWLFASQITGKTKSKERAAILIPAETPEEFLLLEEAIANEMNKFAMAIVVEGGMTAATEASKDRDYKVLYDPAFITNEKSLEHLPELSFRRSGTYPPSPTLLDLHHRLYRLLHETKAGRAWMKESDWKEIDHTIPPSDQIIDCAECSPEPKRDDEEGEGEEKTVLQLADEYNRKDRYTSLPPFNVDNIVPPAKQKVLLDEIREEEIDAAYTLTKAFELRR